MARYEPKDLRTVVFVGHGDSGKTSLVDAALFKAGVNNRLGKVEDGTSASDGDPDEREHLHSIDLSLFHLPWKGRELVLLDAPGYPDFIGESISGLAAADTAVVCVNASSGVLVNTRRAWDLAGQAGVARILCCTKPDHENVDVEALLASLTESFGDRTRVALWPIGSGADFQGVASVLEPSAGLPAAVRATIDKRRGPLVESIVEADDRAMERYLGGETLAPGELDRLLAKSIATGRIVPVLFCAPRHERGGVEEVLDFIARYAPSPQDRPARRGQDAGGADVERPPRGDAPFSAQVFKCLADPFVGRLSFLRVWSGTLAADAHVFLTKAGKTERIAKLYRMQGKEQQPVDRAGPGDLVVVAKLDDAHLSETLCDEATPTRYPPISFPKPMSGFAVEPKTRQDEQRIGPALAKMAESDPTFKVEHDAQTAEIVIHGTSTLHLDVSLKRLKRKFDVQVNTHPPRIAYRETVMGKAEGNHKHKKQSGGHGQYGDVHLRIEPNVRGAGFEFLNEIKGGVIPVQYVPAVEKGVAETMEHGVLAGFPVVDVRVAVTFGSYHDVDSSEAAFKIAAREAFRLAFAQARPALLEPVMMMDVTVPVRFMGELTAYLNTRRGRIQGLDTVGVLQVVKALIPLTEAANFSAELRSMTGGEGSYDLGFDHYDVVPPRMAEAVIARSRAGKTEAKVE